jgi:DNA-binding CsgD family transcriptional regulator
VHSFHRPYVLFTCNSHARLLKVHRRADTPPLVGRTRELTRFDGWITDLIAGHGRAVLVTGEPGIGKSALLQTAREQAKRLDCQIFRSAGDELGQTMPLSPLLEALRVRDSAADARRTAIARLLRGESSAGTGADLATAAAERLIALVGELCSEAPTVLVIDDLQWADPGTVAVWSQLARSVRQLPLLLVGAMRPLPHSDRLIALRRVVPSGAHVRLGPLAEPAVTELVERLTGGRPGEDLLRLAGGASGNPLYLTELVGAIARADQLEVDETGVVDVKGEPVPRSLSAAIADRLDFIDERVRSTLRATALLGIEVSISDLAIVANQGVTDLFPVLEEARIAGILAEAPDGVTFRHPLIREALYDEVPEGVRAAWHRQAARSLAEAGAGVDRVARQLRPALSSAGPGEPVDEWIIRWLIDAAPRLVARAPHMTVELLRLALAAGPLEDAEHEFLACRLAEALYWVGETAEAERVATAALGRVRDPGVLVDLQWTLSQCRITNGRCEESVASLNQALDGPDLQPRHRARLQAILARTHFYLGQDDVAEGVATEALEVARRCEDGWAIGWSLHVLTAIRAVSGDPASALPLFQEALRVTDREPALAGLRLLVQTNHAATLANLDQYDAAIAATRQVRDVAEHSGSAVDLAGARTLLGELLVDTGHWDEALQEVAAMPDELKDPAGVSCDLGVAAIIAFHRGRTGVGRRYLTRAVPHMERLADRIVRCLTLARSLELEHMDDAAGACALLVTELSRGADLEEIEGLLPDTVRLAFETGDLETARQVAAQVGELAESSELPHLAAARDYCRGLLGHDPALLLRAEETYREIGLVLWQAKAAEAAAIASAGAGDRVSARAAFIRSLDLYDSLEAAWDASRLQARLREFGIRRGPRAKHRQVPTGWDALTPAETRIADLLVQGLSNAQIATELYLSRRTVETHVSHILAKLGARSRVDVVREATRRYAASSG